MNTPTKIKATALYAIRFSFSLKNKSANNIENTVSPLERRAVSVAVVNLSPTKNIIGGSGSSNCCSNENQIVIFF